MAQGDKILFSGVAGDSYSELKQQVQGALTATGGSFTWNSSPAVGSTILATLFTELRSAADTAHNLINTGCPTHNGTVNSSNLGYTSSANTSVDASDMSSVCSGNCSGDQSQCSGENSSNLSARKNPNNTTVNTARNSEVKAVIYDP